MISSLPILKAAIRSLDYSQVVDLKHYIQEQVELVKIKNECLVEVRKDLEKRLCCPSCKSQKFTKWGKYKNRQRYQCKDCNRTFNTLSETPFHYLHYHDKALEYIYFMMKNKTLRELAEQCDISLPTSFAWRHKFLKALFKVNESKLRDTIYIDDMLFFPCYTGSRKIEQEAGRKAHKRGQSKDKSEKFMVLTAVDSKGNRIIRCLNDHIRVDNLKNHLGPFVRRKPKNRDILVSDGQICYKNFAKSKNMIHKIIRTSYGQYKTQDNYSLSRVNNLHSIIRRWLGSWINTASKYLQRYLDYFRIFEKTKNIKEPFSQIIRHIFTKKNTFCPVWALKNYQHNS